VLPLSGVTGAGVPQTLDAVLTALAETRDAQDDAGTATRPLVYTP